jgi:polyisoprenoid-binding protein YceI
MTTTTARSRSETVSTLRIDPEHSHVAFTVGKRLFFVRRLTVEGTFAEVAGGITLDPAAPERSHVAVTIQAASVATGNAMRDKHLRGGHFFDVGRFPTIGFQSRSVTPLDPAAGRYRIEGDLTIRDVTRAVALDVFAAPEQDPRAERLQFHATVTLNRHDFDLHFRSPVMRIGDEATITLDVAAVRL